MIDDGQSPRRENHEGPMDRPTDQAVVNARG